MLKVGVIGIGAMGRNHARVYNEIADLRGVADLDAETGNALASRFNARYFKDYRELLDSGIDAVTVATPTSLHHDIVMDALEKDIHVLVEKPIASTVKAGEEMVSRAEELGLVLAAGHIERHNPAVAFTYNALEEGKFGDPIAITSKRVSNFPARIKDVGVILDLGVHDIDVSRYLARAEVVSVYASAGKSKHDKFEDHANILLNFENGITGHIEVNWLTPTKVRKSYITCEKSYVELNYISQSVSVSTQEPPQDIDLNNLYNVPWELDRREFNLRKAEPLKRELEDFLRAIEEKKRPLVTGRDGVEVLKVAEAAIQSYQDGSQKEL